MNIERTANNGESEGLRSFIRSSLHRCLDKLDGHLTDCDCLHKKWAGRKKWLIIEGHSSLSQHTIFTEPDWKDEVSEKSLGSGVKG